MLIQKYDFVGCMLIVSQFGARIPCEMNLESRVCIFVVRMGQMLLGVWFKMLECKSTIQFNNMQNIAQFRATNLTRYIAIIIYKHESKRLLMNPLLFALNMNMYTLNIARKYTLNFRANHNIINTRIIIRIYDRNIYKQGWIVF